VLVRLQGDGFGTPVVQGIDAHFPRESYLRYLPAIYSSDDESRWFLERFLSIVQSEWDDIDRRVREMARHFDIDAAPAEWLDTLASWLAVPLEQGWTSEQKRTLLRAARQTQRGRGTHQGLRAFVQAYLANMSGVLPESQGSWPVIVEGFRERQRLLLSADRAAVLGSASVLWSASVVARPQLDVFAQEGAMRLVSTGDPARDLFHQFSHRFSVAVPAAWIRTADDERMLRRAIDAEKPAHTTYTLHLVAPRFRVGVQSTVGMDTIVGDYPTAHLDCSGGSPAPGRPLRNRLGYDTVLGGSPPSSPRVQIPHSRIGVDTVLN
jgi:phage tail-like protein